MCRGSVPAHRYIFTTTLEIAPMKHILIATSVAALVTVLGSTSAQDGKERRQTPVAASQQTAPESQQDPQTFAAPQTSGKAERAPTVQPLEATGRSVARSASVNASAQEEATAAAEARQVRAAVGRTLERTRELSERLRTDLQLRWSHPQSDARVIPADSSIATR